MHSIVSEELIFVKTSMYGQTLTTNSIMEMAKTSQKSNCLAVPQIAVTLGGEAYIGYVNRPNRRNMGSCWIVTFFNGLVCRER